MYALIEGGTVPRGTVQVSGAKNSATRLLAAALLTEEPVELSNFPTSLVDAERKVCFAERLGAQITADDNAEHLSVQTPSLDAWAIEESGFDVPIRTTYLLAAAQLVRTGRARIPYPGGCQIGGGPRGGRGYDLHVMVWEALGCTVTEQPMFLEVVADGTLKAGQIDFPISTVGGTENALLCASIAPGTTTISNAYITPEIEDLIELLRRMGADIEVTGTSLLVVRGSGGLLAGAHMNVMPDRIEALTWIVYALMSRGELHVKGVPFDAMEVPFIHLAHAGVDLLTNSSSVYVSPDVLKAGAVQPFELATGTHPGVISDMQAFFVLLGLIGSGTSRIFDYRYPGRIAFVSELAKLTTPGVLEAEHGKITVRGPGAFMPGEANSTDLRGSMAVVMAALCAEGTTKITNVQMALRGYNKLETKLRSLGISINVASELSAV